MRWKPETYLCFFVPITSNPLLWIPFLLTLRVSFALKYLLRSFRLETIISLSNKELYDLEIVDMEAVLFISLGFHEATFNLVLMMFSCMSAISSLI
jgi:hypothetical protein